MPSIHSDVLHDEAATVGLIRQLGACRLALDDARAWFEADRSAVTEDWAGPHRRRFDDDLYRLRRELAAVGDQLEVLARQAAVRLAEAEAEQAVRRRLRALAAEGGS